MFIIFGTKPKRVLRAETAHYCRICRTICRASLTSVSKVHHVYFVPLSRGTHLADELLCHGCRVTFGYSDIITPVGSRDPKLLLQAAMNESAQKMPHGAPLRIDRLEDPFAALEYECERINRTGAAQSVSAVLQLLAIFALVASIVCWGFYLAEANSAAKQSLLPLCAGLTTLFGVLAAVVAYRLARSRTVIVRTRLLGHLTNSLRVLDPSKDELERAIAGLKAQGNPIAKSVSAAELCEAMALPPAGR